MQSKSIRAIVIGDVIGRYGRRILEKAIPLIKDKYNPQLLVVNGENSAGGLGIVKKTARELFASGIDVITTGNHVWDKKEALSLLKEEFRIIRPLNYPEIAPGNGFYIHHTPEGDQIYIVNLQGRVFMEPTTDNPFTCMDLFLKENKLEGSKKMIVVDFHAEATAEKQALGFYLDGKVSAVLGTHTHVQTNDLRVLEHGTAYQSDIGMTGSLDSVIGMKKEPIIQKYLDGVNQRFEVEKTNMILDLTVLDIDKKTGKTLHCEYLKLFENTLDEQINNISLN